MKKGFEYTLFQTMPDGTLFALAQGDLAYCVKEQSKTIARGELASNLSIEDQNLNKVKL